jgi:hypothetical protein
VMVRAGFMFLYRWATTPCPGGRRRVERGELGCRDEECG